MTLVSVCVLWRLEVYCWSHFNSLFLYFSCFITSVLQEWKLGEKDMTLGHRCASGDITKRSLTVER